MTHVRFGILGASGIARLAVIPAMANSRNARPVALATRNPAAADWVRGVGIRTIHRSYDDLIADPEVDAVYIPLPNSEHARWATAAARAGKAVLCEKPLATNAKEAQGVMDVCASVGAPLLEGLMYRFHPQHARVRNLISDGAIGDVVEVQAHLSVDLMSPPDPANVRFDPALGGGALLDMGCYAIHVCRSVLGTEPIAVLGHWTLDKNFGVDSAAAGILEFPGERRGVVSCSFKGNGQGYYRIVGRRGLIDVPRGLILGLGDRDPCALIVIVDENGGRREETFAAIDQYQLMIEAFADTVLSEGISAPATDSVANLEVLDAFAESARTGRRVELDLA